MNMLQRIDGWMNIFTGMGILNRDKHASTRPAKSSLLENQDCVDLYCAEGLAKRIVDLPAETMTREWIDVTAGENNEGEGVTAVLEELDAKRHFTDALRWARLFGGGAIVIGLEDGAPDMAEAVNEAAIQRVAFLHVFDKSEVQATSDSLYKDPAHPKYGQPEHYTFNPAGGTSFRVHESRVLRFEGETLPRQMWILNQCWGASVLQACIDGLRNTAVSYSSAASIMHEFVIGVLKMKGLGELIAAGNENQILARLQILDMSKGVLNSLVIDEGEEFTRNTATVTGLADLIDRFLQNLSATSGIPMTVLMGQSPAGLNATGASDIRNWYDACSNEQEDKLLPPLNRLVRLILLSKQGPTKGQEPQDWRVRFNPLWQMSDTEISTIQKTQAETATLLIQNGMAEADELREAWQSEEFDARVRIAEGIAQ